MPEVSEYVSPLWTKMAELEKEFFPYQQRAIEFGVQRKKVLYAHPTGAGKTLMSIATHERLKEGQQFGLIGRDKVLVVCATKAAMSVWPGELRKWLDVDAVTVKGKPEERKKIWEDCAHADKGWWVVTSASLLRDVNSGKMAKFPQLRFWSMIVLEEAHKARNRKSQIFGLLSKMSSIALLELSATAASRGPQDIWGIMNLLDPRMFGSYWKFVEIFCFVEDGAFGKEIYGVRNPEALRKMLSNYIITAPKEEVFAAHKEPIRQIIWVDLEGEERKFYDKLAKDLVAEIGDLTVIAPNIMAAETKLRMLTASPLVLSPTEMPNVGPKLDFILNELEEDPHTVILSPFKKGFEAIGKVLKDQGYKVFMLYGGMDPDLVAQTIKEFKERRGVMLCTIDFAQSFALDTVSVVYFIGLDADPNDLEQAEGRFLRADSDKNRQLVIRYLLCKNTVDERYRDIVNEKKRNTDQFMHLKNPQDLKRILVQHLTQK